MKQITLPKYRVGSAVLRQSSDIFADCGTKALVVGGHRALAAAWGTVREALKEKKIAWIGPVYYGGECTYAHMEMLFRQGQGVDFVIGIGGGKALDTAKGCAHMLDVPVITVPTIAASCADVTSISVVYDDQGVFLESMFHDAPPVCALIDLDVIACAPLMYLRAGIGDSMAKHVECTFASRGCTLSHACEMAVALSKISFTPFLRYGEQALQDAAMFAQGRGSADTEALTQVVLSSAVTTGLVSILIDEVYNGAVAHALFYGLTQLPNFEKRCLHGDAVGYGVLVQEMLDGHLERFLELRYFFQRIGIPVSLSDMGYAWDENNMRQVITRSIRVLYNSRKTPYEVTEKMLKTAIDAVECAGHND